jgi:dienelactone hydrolase
MLRRCGRLAGLLLCLAAACVPLAGRAADKAPLTYKDYDGWNSIRATVLSHDGAWLAYALVPEDADGWVVVRNNATGAEFRGARGVDDVAFSDDARFAFYRIAPPVAEAFAAKRAKKPPAAQPKSGLGYIALATGHETRVERVKSYAIARHGSNWVAYLLEPPTPHPASSGLPSPSPVPSVAPSSSPTASPSPVPDSKKIEDGTTLVLRDLRSDAARTFAHVSAYAISDDEHYLAFVTQAANGKGDGAYILNLGGAADPTPLLAGTGHYAKLAFARDRDTLAFLSDTASFAGSAPRYDLYLWSTGDAAAHVAVGAGTPGLSAGAAPNANGDVFFAKDGSRVFFGTAAAPTPQPSSTPEPMAVDIWNWRDQLLQSEQRVEADADAKRTYLAALTLADGKFVQLGGPHLRDVVVNDNDAYAMGVDPMPYYPDRSWDDNFEDDYIVSLRDGSRRLATKRQWEQCSLSGAGGYLLCYDRDARAWFTVRSRDGRHAYLTRGLGVAFYDELDDHPAPPPSYDPVGWLAGDKRVLISDRFDIWSFDPDGGNATRLTGGVGRERHVRFDYVQLDPEATSIDPRAPFYMLGFDDRTKAMGVYRLPSAAPGRPQALFQAGKLLLAPMASKNGATAGMIEESFNQPPNIFLGTSFANLKQVSDANPQFAKILWGTSQLVHYTSASGKALDGILYLPENFDRHRKYPMLVYFYERFSDTLHRFLPPAPGTTPCLPRYVSNGYVVLIPDIAYTTGHPGKSALGAVMPAIESVVRQGFVDPKRIGVSGHSWGAYQIAYMITQTHAFAAAEAGAAVADMFSAYGGIRWGSGLVREFQYERSQSRIGATPWDRPDLYLENSPLIHIRNVSTPYLTMANDMDDAVPWYQGIEFFTALRRLDKEAYLFVFNGEFHGLHGREQQKYWTVHMDEFFDHFLKGAPTQPWMAKGVDYLHRGERDVRPLFGETP